MLKDQIIHFRRFAIYSFSCTKIRGFVVFSHMETQVSVFAFWAIWSFEQAPGAAHLRATHALSECISSIAPLVGAGASRVVVQVAAGFRCCPVCHFVQHTVFVL